MSIGSGTTSKRLHLSYLAWLALGLASGLGCSGAPAGPARQTGNTPEAPDAPIMALEPGAWFETAGGLVVVGAGRRLRLLLSAPIVACSPALEEPGSAAERAARASLPFAFLSEACRDAHPSILLPEEAETASQSELQKSYRAVARCAAVDLGVGTGWVPRVVSEGEPCASALGLGWRLPRTAEVQGLGPDDRRAMAGALFDAEDRAGFGSLILYARDEAGILALSTLSPAATDKPPPLSEEQMDKPLRGVALRCVRETASAAPAPKSLTPPLPHAARCVQTLRAAQQSLGRTSAAAPSPSLTRLSAWADRLQKTPSLLAEEASLRELEGLLQEPALNALAQEADQERILTERYAELADSLDDPSVSPAERQRRRQEFATLRKRLADQLVRASAGSSDGHTELRALLAHLLELVEPSVAPEKQGKKGAPKRRASLAAIVTRLHALRGDRASSK